VEDHPFFGCPQLLILYIRGYPPYWKPFLHPQPEDAPCQGDRDQLITALSSTPIRNREGKKEDSVDGREEVTQREGYY